MERIWWERVPNALNFVSTVVDQLRQEKSVVVHCGGALPWSGHFTRAVQYALMQGDGSKSIRTLEDAGSPGQYLLAEFCRPERRAAYRPSKSCAQFLAECDDAALHSHYLIVRVRSESALALWEDFISEYVRARSKGLERAAFMLLFSGAHIPAARKGICTLSFDAAISEYDRIVFATQAAAALNAAPSVKSYLTELAAHVAGSDMELCAACIRRSDEFLQSPWPLMQRIAAEQTRSDGAPFALNCSESDVNAMIWRAQIRAIYPRLEEYREAFIKRHRAALRSILPIKAAPGEIYISPEDLELGKLLYLASAGQLPLTPAEYDRLERYKNARNSLSHLTPLSYDDICALGLVPR